MTKAVARTDSVTNLGVVKKIIKKISVDLAGGGGRNDDAGESSASPEVGRDDIDDDDNKAFGDSVSGNGSISQSTFAILADSDVQILQTDDGNALVIVSEDGALEINNRGNSSRARLGDDDDDDDDLSDYRSDSGFERLPPLEIVSNEVLSELNVKQVLECNIPTNATYSYWSKNGMVMV